MANLRISEMDAAGALDGTELVEIVQDGDSRQTTVDDLVAAGDGTYLSGKEIAQTVLAAPAASISFTSIPDTYERLTILLVGRGSNGSASVDLFMQFNADTGANYDSQLLTVNNASLSGATASATTVFYAGSLPAASATAGIGGSSIIEIPYYARTTFNKTFHGDSSYETGNTAADIFRRLNSGRWRNTAAVTQITLSPSTGSFDVGTVATLYGIGA